MELLGVTTCGLSNNFWEVKIFKEPSNRSGTSKTRRKLLHGENLHSFLRGPDHHSFMRGKLWLPSKAREGLKCRW